MAPRINARAILVHFEKIAGSDMLKCKLCNKSVKGDRTFNLKMHLKKLHEINLGDGNASNADIKPITKRIFRRQRIRVSLTKKRLLRSYVGLIAEDNVPFHVLNSPNMQNIIDPICRALSEKLNKNISLNSSNCDHLLKVVASNIEENIKKELKQRFISLKIDTATILSRNIFKIGAQYIKDNKITSAFLGMVEVKGFKSSSSRNLTAKVIDVLTKYDVNQSQIISITSDLISHCSTFKESNEECGADELNEEYMKSIEMFEYTTDLQLGDVQISRCVAYTAQLCALDVIKESSIRTFLFQCRNLVKFIKKNSNGHRETFDLEKLTLPQLDCPTRWGSTYNMIQNVNAAKDVLVKVESIKNKSNNENFELNDDFWDFVNSYCIVFEPLQKTIVKFQEEELHYGNFFAQWLKCKLMTSKIKAKGSANSLFLHIIGTTLLQSIETRTTELLSNESLNACLYLDPRFSHTLSADKKDDALLFLKRLYDRVNRMDSSLFEDDNACLNEYLYQKVQPKIEDNIDVYSKIENLDLTFQRVETNVVDFWKEMQTSDPELYSLANICLAIPATQIKNERASSYLKLILTEDPKTLENILMAKLNSDFLDHAIDNMYIFENDE